MKQVQYMKIHPLRSLRRMLEEEEEDDGGGGGGGEEIPLLPRCH